MAPINSGMLSYCADGTQIFRSYVGDGVIHCKDGSDEAMMLPDVTAKKIEESYDDIIKRLEEVEKKEDDNFGASFWTWFVDVLDRALPILNSLILFGCGGKKAHSKYKRRRARPQQPQVPAPAPSLLI